MNSKHGSYKVEEDGDEEDEGEDDEGDDDGDEHVHEHNQDYDNGRLVDRESTRYVFKYRTLTGTCFSRKLTNRKHADWRKMADTD
ncbi:PREDICTED: ATPase family AAA domain-containing protein 2-like [Eufriesea mexicana]|uniref:ATPase family AAA domain-containing protein 2-like n=1 Tax=Eufriesea mexicana TaxID=516756 RepID=UPI00083C5B4A|nr:PREDICTED: ATPase family AAA domain-containing protein 2-like [Eufriesea mexicana]